MDKWSQILEEALKRASSAEEVFELVLASARELGFDHCAYGLSYPLPLTSPKVFLISNYPDEWRELYVRRGYLGVDPTVAHGRRSQSSLVWSDAVFAQAPDFWDEAQSHGLRVGWAQSCFDLHGRAGMLSLSRQRIALSQAELNANEPRMRWLAHAADQAFSKLVAPQLNMGPDTPLTPRETEILRWLADGKTSSEAAEILHLSVNTVNFHLKRAMVKLRAATRTGAVARAALLGLLS